MLKQALAVLAAALVTLTCAASSAAQRDRWQDRYYDNERYREYRGYQAQRDTPVRGRPDPNSYDGRRTGQPRTCGSNFMQYDAWGVPYGPYCN